MLLLGSDNDAKFGGTVLTQSMILARVNPTTRQVVMEFDPAGPVGAAFERR